MWFKKDIRIFYRIVMFILPALLFQAASAESGITSESDIAVSPGIAEYLLPLPSEEPRDMVLIPAGDFWMGLSYDDIDDLVRMQGRFDWYKNAHPRRKVYLESYYIDRTEVTNEQYAKFDKDHTYPESRADQPVTGKTWCDAADYARWIGGALPTEAQWEKAARGIMGRLFPWGDMVQPINSYHAGIKVGDTSFALPVMNFAADRSPYGVYGMAGNVAEWTSSPYIRYEGNCHRNRNYSRDLKVIRGGSFIWPQQDGTTASRRGANQHIIVPYVGFRCVMSAADYNRKYRRNR